jgi:hypothetical protein
MLIKRELPGKTPDNKITSKRPSANSRYIPLQKNDSGLTVYPRLGVENVSKK